jgi:predicted LPLAT superfamily acyltransferase
MRLRVDLRSALTLVVQAAVNERLDLVNESFSEPLDVRRAERSALCGGYCSQSNVALTPIQPVAHGRLSP